MSKPKTTMIPAIARWKIGSPAPRRNPCRMGRKGLADVISVFDEVGRDVDRSEIAHDHEARSWPPKVFGSMTTATDCTLRVTISITACTHDSSVEDVIAITVLLQ